MPMSDRDDWKRDLAGYEPLRELHESLRAEVRTRWQRSLPFADELFDRWERATHLGFGSGASIYDSSLVIGDVRVGEHTWIGPFTVLDGSGGGLVIGHHCSISAGVQIYTHDTVAWALTGGRASAMRSPTAIGDRTYVGPNAVIARGVTIGSGCVIGAASLVNRDVPDGKIAVGTPTRVVGHVEVEGDDVRMVYDAR
jgi:acetyltransferase-like isoleucine patch superfamily enzyme